MKRFGRAVFRQSERHGGKRRRSKVLSLVAVTATSATLLVTGVGYATDAFADTAQVNMGPTQYLTAGPTETATIQVAVDNLGHPVVGGDVLIQVATGPNAGQSFEGDTDSNGLISWTYYDTGGAGGDGLVASFVDGSGNLRQGFTSVIWQTPTPPPPAPTSISVGNQSGDYNNSDSVSATLSDSNGPVANEQLTFTLNSAETCTGTTDSSGTASCFLTPGEAAGNYSLGVSFGGDSGANLQGTSSSATFTVNRAPTTLVYTGATNAHYPETFTASGVLTDADNNSPVSGRSVTFALSGGGSCTATTAADGTVSCPITLTQAAAVYPISSSLGGDGYYQASNTSTPFTDILGYTQLVYTGALTSRYDEPFTASATLTDPDSLLPGGVQPVVGRSVTFTLGGVDTCTGTTAADGTVSCKILVSRASGPWPASATYPIVTSFTSDGYYKSASTSATFTVTHQLDTLTYTGATEVANGYPATLSGVLTETAVRGNFPIAGRTVTFTLGTGSSAQTCSATTSANGSATCTLADVAQPDSPPAFTPALSATFAGDTYFIPAAVSRTVDLLYYTGRSYGAAVSGLLAATPDTGEITTAQWVDPKQTVLSANVAGISLGALSAEVKTGQKQSIATGGVASSNVGLLALPAIQIGAVQATSTTTCAGSTGSTTIASLKIAGVAYTTATVTPNYTINLGVLTIVLNQQVPIPGGLTVNAVSISAPLLGVSIVLGSATSDIHNCT